MFQTFGIIGGVLGLIWCIPYIKDIFLKNTKPERASWLIWTVLGVISFFSQLSKGATDLLWLTGGQTLGVAIVFILSLRFGVGGLAKRDIIALSFAGFSLLVWFLTKEATDALFLVIAIDTSGSILTIIKSYEDPESETLIAWVLSGTSGLFGALAVGKWDFILLSYPLYLFIINYLIVGSMILGKNKAIAKKEINS